MKLDFTTLDVFTAERYQGNPLSIIRVPANLKSSLSQEQKQIIAKEFNLSEIVFLHLPTDPNSVERNIDIFTSYAEVPFAGHPAVGTSFFLLNPPEAGRTIGDENVRTLITKAGPISITPNGEGVKAIIPQNFHRHTKSYTSPLIPGVENPICSIVKGMSFIYVELPDLAMLAKVTAQDGNLESNPYTGCNDLDEGWREGLVGTMYFVDQGLDANGERKYRTRMIASREDPGTGSASSGLGCYLALRNWGHGRRTEKFRFTQGVEMGRRNEIAVEVEVEEGVVKEVLLGGEAVVVMEGSLEI
ncbi:phenazine biosynthesis protein-like protein phzf family [Amylocarpus encephaloides]|uniref:Phenazine biosynthesis protein-like protein phzf family n=1 Tax=Amylocarpus encephaloides TaxID=45428 RepID=A0A9P7YEZ6_9HELO|nr:phenazine biosynthesis protein-like protein phzf family [Amylocarpus encephaloides]